MGRVDEMALVGGHPAVDFVNTLGGLPGVDDDEYLVGEADLDLWCRRVGLITEEATVGADRATFRDAIELRTALDRLLRAHLDGRPGDSGSERTVREFYAEAVGRGSLHLDDSRFELVWIRSHRRRPLWILAAAAVDLLTGDQLGRLTHCGRCRWLFLDLSRSHTRRWCTMNSCGAITKMRRYRGSTP